MNLGTILSRIETGIQDPSFTREDNLLPLVNEFVTEVSELFLFPSLQSYAQLTVAADLEVNHIDLPTNYHRDLYRVYNVNLKREVNIRSNVKALERLYDGFQGTGYIQDVAVQDRELWFRPTIEQEQALDLFYYRKPVLIEDADDEDMLLDGVPENLAVIAVDYALMQLYNLVEDGVTGMPVNTEKYSVRYQAGLGKLNEYCKQSPKQVPVVQRSARFF